jgi:hypothetical protein
MQYYKPAEPHLFVGDCMPFWHDGVFHLYYLVDEGHHAALGGLGGHQWAHASTTDLRRWTHHPMALPISQPWEGSMCTGSVFFHEGTWYAFYATRTRERKEHLSLARSPDGVHFGKAEPNPFFIQPKGYDPRHCRDPVVFREATTGRFHLLASAWLEAPPVSGRGGCLAHLESEDLLSWTLREPFLVPGLPGVPECSDYFRWGDWYYLLFSNGGVARYRMSRAPFGPWQRPPLDTFEGAPAKGMKTAAFGPDRRIGVAWLPWRRDEKDQGGYVFGDNAVFREIVQESDGTLYATWPREMVPAAAAALTPAVALRTPAAETEPGGICLHESDGLEAVRLTGMPQDALLRLTVRHESGYGQFGLRLRAAEAFDSGYDLYFLPTERSIHFGEAVTRPAEVCGTPFSVEIAMHGSVIDICVDGCHCLVDRCPEQHGDQLTFYALNAEVAFEGIEVRPLQQF